MLFKKKYVSINLTESDLGQRNQGLSFLLEMSNFLSITMNLKELLSGALSKVLEYFDLDAGRMYLIDDEGRYLHLVAHQGIDSRGFEKVHINESFSGKSARTKSFIAQHVSELEDKKRAALLSSKGFKIIICIPLISINKVRGVMNLASCRVISLDQQKIDLFTAIGNQIAVAANNARLYEDLKSKIETLKEKKELIKVFAYSISHDLKSPATSLYVLTKRLQEKYGASLDEKGGAYCDQILKTADQMVTLVEKINAYIVTKENPLNLEKIKVKEITETIRNEFSKILKQRQIKWSEPETLPEIVADKLALSRVFRNLLDNALKYGGDELFQIKIGHEENEGFHLFSFSDDGVGIKEGDKKKIFEAFQRSETSRGIPGSGLGLAIIREIAERHQGRAWIVSREKEGTTFYISISKDLKTTD
ncbi:MAG: ATP-binding protein [Desulfobacteraceae bacterium]|jgi:K+-sensing histidine kinase KdpD